MKSGRKVIIIGLDGASWNFIDEGIKRGLLPNFEKIINLGVRGDLKPPVPPLSPSSWTSVYTGVKPNKHKIYGFTKLDKNRKFFRFVTSRDRKSPPFWTLLPGKYRVILFNLPFTYPVEPVNGIIVSGFGTPSLSSNFTYPPHFKDFLLSNFPDYNIDYNELEFLSKKMDNYTKMEFLNNIRKIFDTELKINMYLLINEKFDIFFTVFRVLDVIQHYFWKDRNIIFEFYKKIDNFLNYIINNFLENNHYYLFIISDHGFDEVHTYVYINNILEQKRILVINKSFIHSILQNKINAELFKNLLIKLKLRKLLTYIRNSNLLWYLLKIIPSKEQNYFVNINWSKTKAFFLEGSDGLIYINKKNCSNTDYFSVCNLVKSALKDIYDKDKNNEVFSAILDFNELYGVLPTEEDPDIILIPNKGYRLVSYNPNGNIFGPPLDKTLNERYGDHSDTGIFIACGPDVRSKYNIGKIYVWDILPTIFHIIGIGIPPNIDGKVLKDIFKNDSPLYSKEIKKLNEKEIIKSKIRNIINNKKINL